MRRGEARQKSRNRLTLLRVPTRNILNYKRGDFNKDRNKIIILHKMGTKIIPVRKK